MEQKLDFKKEYKDLYLPGTQPVLIEVPPMRYIMVSGSGAPESASYQQAVALLYALSYTIKMSKLGPGRPQGYFEYVVAPLEGLWQLGAARLLQQREDWQWISMIRQPDFVTPEVFDWACVEARKKKPQLDTGLARLETFHEGLCAQLLHTGPYATEDESIGKLSSFMKDRGLRDLAQEGCRHHEIYLCDPRRTSPERLKTVLRHPASHEG